MTKYSSYILYLLISILVVIVYVNGFGPLDGLQRSLNDLMCRITAPDSPQNNVVLVTIDGRAMDEFGQWPWNRDKLADLAAATASGEPRVLVLDVDLLDDAAQDSAGYTDILAGQLSWMENVVIPFDIALATYRANLTSNPKYLFNNSVEVANPLGLMSEDASLLTRKVFLPAEKLLVAGAHLGFDYESPDEDRVLRHHRPLTHFEGYYYPSLALIASALYLNVPSSMIRVTEGEQIEIGAARTIPTNSKGEIVVSFSRGNTFSQYSAADVLSDSFEFSRLKDKLVFITVDDMGREEVFDTPVNPNTSATFVKATTAANIINGQFLVEHNNQPVTDMLILFIIGAACAFLLPRVNLMYRMIILASGLIILVNVNYFMLSSFQALINTVYIGLELILFMIASPLLDSALLTGEAQLATPKPKRSMPKMDSSKSAGNSSETPVRELKDDPNSEENVRTAALGSKHDADTFHDYQAISLGDGAPQENPENLSDSQKNAHTSAAPLADESPVMADSSSDIKIPDFGDSGKTETPDSTGMPLSESQRMQLQTRTPDIKNLGRYQVTGVLGKGAMGLVYKGVDPAINRPVALKTIRLDFVTDPEEMQELKERLHREAQAAGKLSHPNIVTIYDVGSEGSLQFIAMEYLEGQTLEDLIKRKTKFNYRIIAQIITQICGALDYAHDQGIVHRDIKPANIMVLSDYRVKVMDYGIARIDSNSMTKTGIAMGTPNYISPEQLKGMPTDRRADLFSLGVVMYEMLLGRRPFKGENITSLIYAIMNHEPEKPSQVNPQVPLLFDHIIGRALQKEPGGRYQRASEVATDLRDFVESFAKR